MKFELEYSIMVPGKDGKEVETKILNFGRMKAKHLKLLPEAVFDTSNEEKNVKPQDIVPLIAGLANIPEESAEEIDVKDLVKIGGEILPVFLEGFHLQDQNGKS